MRRVRAQRGQILPLAAVALTALLGIGAFSVDIGYAYYAKRQLQGATDAAALAGAQDLPSSATAFATAASYASANTPSNLSNPTFTYQAKCTATAILSVGCNAAVNPNNLVVTAAASTNTWFAGIFGINHFNVTAHANACSPCNSTPVDVVIALDRTGSMCIPTDAGGGCTDLNSAKAGIRTMLGILNPPYAKVGIVSFPPVQTTATTSAMLCSAPYNVETAGVPTFRTRSTVSYNGYYAYNGYDAATRGYVTDALTTNYKSSAGVPVLTTGMYLHTAVGPATACVQSDGLTSYSEALRQAQAELVRNGRPDVPDFIVFLTDGEANIGSVYSATHATFPQNGKDDLRPCQSGIDAATTIKATGTTIYSIGYALGSNTPCTRGTFLKKATNGNWSTACTAGTTGCYHFASTDNGELRESPAINSDDTLLAIASSPETFYSPLSASQLNAIFTAIATDISAGSSRLVEDSF